MAECKYPIGVQSFDKLRADEFIYIDKTAYIEPLLRGNVYFLSRPRRFGKSLFLSTLASYFRGEKELFKGLAIEEAEARMAAAEGREPWIEYPVLYIDLNINTYDAPEVLNIRLASSLEELEERYGVPNLVDKLPAERFAALIQNVYQKTGRKVVVLVDEYDKPLLHTLSKGRQELHEQYREILAGFYVVLKSLDKYIRFAFFTGVTKFSKLSVFSGLNNLEDISLDTAYAGLCGITQGELLSTFAEEIDRLAQDLGHTRESMLETLTDKYDGYCFSINNVHVYNPFSLLNVFKKGILGSYWFSTGTPTFLVEMLRDRQYDYSSLNKDIFITLDDLENAHEFVDNPVQVLYQAGYLTIKGYDPEFRLYKLGFPNDEVKYGFLDNLIPVYTSIAKDNSGLFIGNFVRDLQKEKLDSFMERMYTACAGLPYSLAAKENIKMRERDYQIAFYLIFTLMGQFAQTEVQNSRGRCDCVVFTSDTIYIFEFKLMGSGTPQSALEQIKEQGYAEPYQTSGKKIILIGAAFGDGIDEDTADTWVAETL